MSSLLHRAQIYELSPAWLFMCHGLLFQEMNHLPRRAHWYDLSTGWSFICFLMQWLNVNPTSHRAQWYVILLAPLFKWYTTDHIVQDASQYESLVSIFFPWFMDMNSRTHRAQIYELSPTWYFICLCLRFQQMKHLPHWGHWQDETKYVSSCGGWIRNNCHIDHNNIVISLTWLFMCIVWWFLMLFLNISSTRNHLFLQRAFYRANSCWILLASLCLFHPPGIILF